LDSYAFAAAVRSGAADEYDEFPFLATALLANTFYRVVLLPTTTGARNYLYSTSVNLAAELDFWPGGQNFHWTSVNGAPTAEADWAQTLTKRPLGWSLIFDQFDDAVAAAGGGGAGLMMIPGAGLVAAG
jgi:hypothetical protein